MTTPKGKGRGRKRDDKDNGGHQPPEDEEQQGPGNPDADPVRIHEEFAERRLGGGAPATPERYTRAVEQWNELPGAVRVPPTGPTGDSTPAAEEDEEGGDEGHPA
jgi:hypothetical protein